jgi:hypothetical protein
VRAEHQAGRAFNFAFMAAADIADGIEMRAHAGLAHPSQNEFGRGSVLACQEYPGQIPGRLRDRRKRADAADNLASKE